MRTIVSWMCSFAVATCSLALFIMSESGIQFAQAVPETASVEQESVNAIIAATVDQKSPAATDPWGTRLRFVEIGDLRWTTSAGPDMEFDTLDDIKCPSEKP